MNHLPRNHLTTILPTFRIASACSDEDMLSSNENEEVPPLNAGSDECISGPSTSGSTLVPTDIKSNFAKLSIGDKNNKLHLNLQQKCMFQNTKSDAIFCVNLSFKI